MPSIVYNFYNNDDFVVALRYNMETPIDEYYSYLFPATISMILGMRVPFLSENQQTIRVKNAIENCRKFLSGKSNIGVILILLGGFSGILELIVPAELKYIFYLFGRLVIVGVFYIFYSDIKQKKVYLLGVITFILLQSLGVGMFGDLIYTLLLGGLIVLLGYKVKNYTKFSFAILGFVFILIIQSIKHDYRAVAWSSNSENQNSTFVNLVLSRLNEPDKYLDIHNLFPTVSRFNQGMIVSKVMEYVPRYAPFAEGETVYNSVFATFVPRFLWPDKPTAGGHQNMLRFTGAFIEGYSMNIGVIGEAYANYGKNGGIIFMFFFGLFFNFIFYLLLLNCRSKPTIILWVPFLYLNAIQAETDTLMTINSTIKNILFMVFCYWSAYRFMRIKL
jgi:hypothetical protein